MWHWMQLRKEYVAHDCLCHCVSVFMSEWLFNSFPNPPHKQPPSAVTPVVMATRNVSRHWFSWLLTLTHFLFSLTATTIKLCTTWSPWSPCRSLSSQLKISNAEALLFKHVFFSFPTSLSSSSPSRMSPQRTIVSPAESLPAAPRLWTAPTLWVSRPTETLPSWTSTWRGTHRGGSQWGSQLLQAW